MDDYKILDKIKKDLLNYNYIDLMKKISILTTLPKNQDINGLICCLINSLLDCKNDEKKPIVTMPHFNTVIKELQNLSIKTKIDPVENLFFDTVVLDKQYLSYENINTNPSYILNNLISSIVSFYNDHNHKDFFNKAISIIRFIMNLQTDIIKSSKQVNPEKRDYKREIYFCNNNYYNTLKKYIEIDYKDAYSQTNGEIDEFIIEDNFIPDEIYGHANGMYSFFIKPFLKFNNKIIILDPTLLTTACNHYLLMLARRYGCINEVIKRFKECIIETTKQNIYKIDNPYNILEFKSENKQIDYLLEEFTYNKAMLHIFVSDNEDTYNSDSLFKEIVDNFFIDDLISNVIKIVKSSYKEIYVNISIITFGKGLFVSSNIELPCIMLSPYQLDIISKNKRFSNNILYYFINDKFKNNKDAINSFFTNIYGDFTYFIVYDEHQCSYYINDSMPQKNLNIFIEFDVIYEYVYKAFSPKNNNVINYNNGFSKITNIENNKYFGKINDKNAFIIKGSKEYFCAILFSDDGKIQTIADFLSYWFSEAVEFINFNGHNCIFILSYFTNNTNFSVNYVENDFYEIKFGDIDLDKMADNNQDNTTEREFFVNIINGSNISISEKELNIIFGDKLKKKIYVIDTTQNFMVPSIYFDYPIPIASKAKMSDLLDVIGEHFIDNNDYKVCDVIIGQERAELCNKIVEYVYNMFTNLISKYDFFSVINISYSALEKLIPETILRNDNYKNQIHLYPNKEKEIRELLSEYNATSISLRFIIEYAGAIQNAGSEKCDFIDLEILLAYVRTIIDWATASDLFRYEMIDDEITVLQSNRFGYNKENVEKINDYISNGHYTYISKQRNSSNYVVSMDEKDKIFRIDFGYSFSEYVSILGVLAEYGETIKNEIKSITYNDWIELCKNKNIPENLYKVLDDISIERRDDYFSYKHYARKNFYPWRFNRLFSLFRRPIIKVDNIYYWGNRNLQHNAYYISNLINQGIFDSGKKGKNYSIIYSGTIAEKRGELFNDLVYDIFSSFPNFKAYKNIVSVNSKHIASIKGNDLGDIDILAISYYFKKIFIIEVKDYSLSKNVNDLYIEITKLFDGDNNDKSAYDKHIARFNWIIEHRDDLFKEYKIDDKGWKIIPLFVTNQPMISRRYKRFKKINMIDYDLIDYNYLKKLK